MNKFCLSQKTKTTNTTPEMINPSVDGKEFRESWSTPKTPKHGIEHVNNTLLQGKRIPPIVCRIINGSNFEWDSPLFLVPNKFNKYPPPNQRHKTFSDVFNTPTDVIRKHLAFYMGRRASVVACPHVQYLKHFEVNTRQVLRTSRLKTWESTFRDPGRRGMFVDEDGQRPIMELSEFEAVDDEDELDGIAEPFTDDESEPVLVRPTEAWSEKGFSNDGSGVLEEMSSGSATTKSPTSMTFTTPGESEDEPEKEAKGEADELEREIQEDKTVEEINRAESSASNPSESPLISADVLHHFLNEAQSISRASYSKELMKFLNFYRSLKERKVTVFECDGKTAMSGII